MNHPLDRLPSPSNNGISQHELNIEDKKRTNLFPWKGQFSPQLVEVLLRNFASRDQKVLDPFMGSGTVLYEAGLLGFEAFGSEINPAAYSLAHTYTFINESLKVRQKIINSIEAKISGILNSNLPLFSEDNESDTFEKLVDVYHQTDNLQPRIIIEALITLLDFRKLKVPIDKICSEWHKLKQRIFNFPYSEAPLMFLNRDARDLRLANNSIGIVITSPPYINVFNYHQQYRSSMEAIGWDLLTVARSEIGSNRKHRGNRFLTVTQYILDMVDVFLELHRIIKDSGRVIFVVGRESNIRKTPFYNSVIINDLATQVCGFYLSHRQERVFLNRFGNNIYEDILYYNKYGKPLDGEEREQKVRELALNTLIEAKCRAPIESCQDLEDAISKVNYVKASVLYFQEQQKIVV